MVIEISNNKKIFQAAVEGNIVLQTERKGAPGRLTFNVLPQEGHGFSEGNSVALKTDNGKGVFFGFIFSKKRDKKGIISVVAYDQLRYLKNKYTYVYRNKTASEVIKMLAADFGLKCGKIADTKFKIKERRESNQSLFDIIQMALELTLTNKKQMYVLYDDFGKLRLKNIKDMFVPLVVDETSAENFTYNSSIDSSTYTKVELRSNDTDKKKKVERYIETDKKNIKKYGVLLLFENIQEGENGKEKAKALLELHKEKTKTLSINKVFGDLRVRGGSVVGVIMDLGDVKLQNKMIVDKCKHTFNNSGHFMDLTLIGGGFSA